MRYLGRPVDKTAMSNQQRDERDIPSPVPANGEKPAKRTRPNKPSRAETDAALAEQKVQREKRNRIPLDDDLLTAKRRQAIIDRISINDDGHWYWLGSVGKDGRARHTIQVESHRSVSVLASRAVFALFAGDPGDLEVDHIESFACPRECVNPQHLRAVTRVENQRAFAEARFVTCKRGHLLDPHLADVLVYVNDDGVRRRLCRTCRRAYQKEWWARTGKARLHAKRQAEKGKVA